MHDIVSALLRLSRVEPEAGMEEDRNWPPMARGPAENGVLREHQVFRLEAEHVCLASPLPAHPVSMRSNTCIHGTRTHIRLHHLHRGFECHPYFGACKTHMQEDPEPV